MCIRRLTSAESLVEILPKIISSVSWADDLGPKCLGGTSLIALFAAQ